jgi:DNA-binding IclR family transcriptional regulator
MTESEFTEFCQSTELKQYTKRTITNRDALWKVLVKTRKRGYATDLGELREGIHCIGSPIHDSANKVIAAISISAPAIRLTKERMKKLEAPLVEVAREISRKMGLSLLSKRNSLVLRRGER